MLGGYPIYLVVLELFPDSIWHVGRLPLDLRPLGKRTLRDTWHEAHGYNWRCSREEDFGTLQVTWYPGIFDIGVSLNGGTPISHPKMIIFSRKTNGCWGNPPFWEPPI